MLLLLLLISVTSVCFSHEDKSLFVLGSEAGGVFKCTTHARGPRATSKLEVFIEEKKEYLTSHLHRHTSCSFLAGWAGSSSILHQAIVVRLEVCGELFTSFHKFSHMLSVSVAPLHSLPGLFQALGTYCSLDSPSLLHPFSNCASPYHYPVCSTLNWIIKLFPAKWLVFSWNCPTPPSPPPPPPLAFHLLH